jgi:hypothetical protein
VVYSAGEVNMSVKGGMDGYTRAFLAATAVFLVSRVILPGTSIGVNSIG